MVGVRSFTHERDRWSGGQGIPGRLVDEPMESPGELPEIMEPHIQQRMRWLIWGTFTVGLGCLAFSMRRGNKRPANPHPRFEEEELAT
ncbi:MAG: hypothetical protein KDA60_07170 [Planctomycetales bacterium]|nr:hypothetical protein [Planctomycetales bacterium]